MMESIGDSPSCAAVPAWRCTDVVLECKADSFPDLCLRFGLSWGGSLPAEGRGAGARPTAGAGRTCPTYDEVIGRFGVTPSTFNDHMLEQIDGNEYNVLTIHAEVEGIVAGTMFDEFLTRARDRGLQMVPLSHLIPEDRSQLPVAPLVRSEVAGREGWLSVKG